MRRLLDMLTAAVGLVLVSPLFAAIAVVIKLEDGGPVFYVHGRVGRGFQKFGLLKFRTMVPGADRLGGPVTVAADPRVTRPGRWLRKYKLDELPQLVNILRGDMRWIGPRPECECYVRMFSSQYAALLRDRPGLTDAASIAYRYEEQMLDSFDVEQQYVTQILPHKLRLSTEYSEHRTLLLDMETLFRAAVGAYLRPERPEPSGSLPEA